MKDTTGNPVTVVTGASSRIGRELAGHSGVGAAGWTWCPLGRP